MASIRLTERSVRADCRTESVQVALASGISSFAIGNRSVNTIRAVAFSSVNSTQSK